VSYKQRIFSFRWPNRIFYHNIRFLPKDVDQLAPDPLNDISPACAPSASFDNRVELFAAPPPFSASNQLRAVRSCECLSDAKVLLHELTLSLPPGTRRAFPQFLAPYFSTASQFCVVFVSRSPILLCYSLFTLPSLFCEILGGANTSRLPSSSFPLLFIDNQVTQTTPYSTMSPHLLRVTPILASFRLPLAA